MHTIFTQYCIKLAKHIVIVIKTKYEHNIAYIFINNCFKYLTVNIDKYRFNMDKVYFKH